MLHLLCVWGTIVWKEYKHGEEPAVDCVSFVPEYMSTVNARSISESHKKAPNNQLTHEEGTVVILTNSITRDFVLSLGTC